MAYFIPYSPVYQNVVRNLLSDHYWKVLIDVDDDDILEDITPNIHNNKITGTNKHFGQNYKAISNKYEVILRNSYGLFKGGYFTLAKCAIETQISSAGFIRLFTGYVTKLCYSKTIKYR